MEIDFNIDDRPSMVTGFETWRDLLIEEISRRLKNDRDRKVIKAQNKRFSMEAWWSGHPLQGESCQAYFLADALNDVFDGVSDWVVFERVKDRKDGDEAVWTKGPNCGFTFHDAVKVVGEAWAAVGDAFKRYALLQREDYMRYRLRQSLRILLVRKEDSDKEKNNGWKAIGGEDAK